MAVTYRTHSALGWHGRELWIEESGSGSSSGTIRLKTECVGSYQSASTQLNYDNWPDTYVENYTYSGVSTETTTAVANTRKSSRSTADKNGITSYVGGLNYVGRFEEDGMPDNEPVVLEPADGLDTYEDPGLDEPDEDGYGCVYAIPRPYNGRKETKVNLSGTTQIDGYGQTVYPHMSSAKNTAISVTTYTNSYAGSVNVAYTRTLTVPSWSEVTSTRMKSWSETGSQPVDDTESYVKASKCATSTATHSGTTVKRYSSSDGGGTETTNTTSSYSSRYYTETIGELEAAPRRQVVRVVDQESYEIMFWLKTNLATGAYSAYEDMLTSKSGAATSSFANLPNPDTTYMTPPRGTVTRPSFSWSDNVATNYETGELEVIYDYTYGYGDYTYDFGYTDTYTVIKLTTHSYNETNSMLESTTSGDHWHPFDTAESAFSGGYGTNYGSITISSVVTYNVTQSFMVAYESYLTAETNATTSVTLTSASYTVDGQPSTSSVVVPPYTATVNTTGTMSTAVGVGLVTRTENTARLTTSTIQLKAAVGGSSRGTNYKVGYTGLTTIASTHNHNANYGVFMPGNPVGIAGFGARLSSVPGPVYFTVSTQSSGDDLFTTDNTVDVFFPDWGKRTELEGGRLVLTKCDDVFLPALSRTTQWSVPEVTTNFSTATTVMATYSSSTSTSVNTVDSTGGSGTTSISTRTDRYASYTYGCDRVVTGTDFVLYDTGFKTEHYRLGGIPIDSQGDRSDKSSFSFARADNGKGDCTFQLMENMYKLSWYHSSASSHYSTEEVPVHGVTKSTIAIPAGKAVKGIICPMFSVVYTSTQDVFYKVDYALNYYSLIPDVGVTYPYNSVGGVAW